MENRGKDGREKRWRGSCDNATNYGHTCSLPVELKLSSQRSVHVTLQWMIDMALHREYTLSDGKVTFPVNLTLQGDVTVVVYHARSTLGGKVQGKMTSIRVFQLQFHTGFIKTSATKLKYSR